MGGVREQPDSLPSSQSPSLIGGSDELELPSSPSPKYICFITFSICFRISETLFFFFFLSRSYLKPHCPYLLLSAPSTHPAPNQSPVLTSHPAGCVLGGGSAPVPPGAPTLSGAGTACPPGRAVPAAQPLLPLSVLWPAAGFGSCSLALRALLPPWGFLSGMQGALRISPLEPRAASSGLCSLLDPRLLHPSPALAMEKLPPNYCPPGCCTLCFRASCRKAAAVPRSHSMRPTEKVPSIASRSLEKFLFPFACVFLFFLFHRRDFLQQGGCLGEELAHPPSVCTGQDPSKGRSVLGPQGAVASLVLPAGKTAKGHVVGLEKTSSLLQTNIGVSHNAPIAVRGCSWPQAAPGRLGARG